jgi:large conductance mechanosensitive channel
MEDLTVGVFDRARDLGGRGFRGGLSTMGDFQKFIMRGNVVDLAVGVIIGTAFNSVVQGFVKDIITPLIPGGTQNFANLRIPIYGGHAYLLVGDLISIIISFLIIALVVYFFVVKPINAMEEGYNRLHPKQPATPTTRDCPYCLSTIPLGATRCAYCTAQLPPADASAAQAR